MANVDYITKNDLDEVVVKLDNSMDRLALTLMEHVDKRIDEVKVEIKGLNKEYEHLIDTLDTFLKRLDNIEADNAVRDVEVKRLERWIRQVATKAGVKLEY